MTRVTNSFLLAVRLLAAGLLIPAVAGGEDAEQRTPVRLSASRGLAPHGPIDQPPERIEIDTRNLDIDGWHHLLVSWDLRGDRQRIWLLLNGSGQQLCVPAGTFPPGRFASLEFGNRPSGWQTPFIPLDGAIDALRVQAESVANRLVEE